VTGRRAFAAFLLQLEAALRGPLPGAAAQETLAPRPRRDWPPGVDPAAARRAAGLLLVFPHAGRAHLALTLRAEALGRHGGQISLPGGAIDPGETAAQAAFREAAEEIGLRDQGVRILGALTPVDIPLSGFRLQPIVAASRVRPLLIPSTAEVQRVLEVAVEDLMAPIAFGWTTATRDERTYDVPALTVDGARIWGATAMVLAEFLTLLGWRAPRAGQER
jgi:8-oxo-dGTP pyrophosphatase MutT (NUDIX family)